MESELLKLAQGNGLWACLFVVLFLYVIYDSRHREKNYQEVIDKNQNIIQELSSKYNIVEEIRQDVTYLKNQTTLRR